jgi:hypothetical protein
MFCIIDRSSEIAVARFVIGPRAKISTFFIEYFSVNLMSSIAPNGDGWRKIFGVILRQADDVVYVSSASNNKSGILKPAFSNGSLENKTKNKNKEIARLYDFYFTPWAVATPLEQPIRSRNVRILEAE